MSRLQEKKKQGRLRGRGHPHKYPQPLRTSHLFTLVFEWGGRKGGGDNVQEAHGQGTGNSWLLLPRPAIESRPQDLLHPPSCAHQGTTRLESPGCVHQRGRGGCHQTGVRLQTSRKGLNIRSPSPGRLVLGLCHHLSQSKESGFLQLVKALGRVPKVQEATSSEGLATAVQESIAQVSIWTTECDGEERYLSPVQGHKPLEHDLPFKTESKKPCSQCCKWILCITLGM